jgi:hypothetical protein
MDPRIALYYLTSLAGLVMVVGGIWLIYKEKIYIDRESKEPIEIESPLGKFKSNYPALALFALGFFPLWYSLHAINNMDIFVKVEQVGIHGPIEASTYPVLVYAVRAHDSLNAKREFSVRVPYLGKGEDDYKLLLIVNGHVLSEAAVNRKASTLEATVTFQPLVVEPSPYEPHVAPIPAAYK